MPHQSLLVNTWELVVGAEGVYDSFSLALLHQLGDHRGVQQHLNGLGGLGILQPLSFVVAPLKALVPADHIPYYMHCDKHKGQLHPPHSPPPPPKHSSTDWHFHFLMLFYSKYLYYHKFWHASKSFRSIFGLHRLAWLMGHIYEKLNLKK